MHKSGDDLSKKRRMNLAFLFPSEHGAQAFRPKAEALGFEVEVTFFEAKDSWDAECSLVLAPTHRAVSNAETRLTVLAASDGGRPDGWGCMAQ